jgi:hypothetical protein
MKEIRHKGEKVMLEEDVAILIETLQELVSAVKNLRIS